MKPKIYVTRRLPQPTLDRPAEVFEVNPEDRPSTKAELLQKVRGRDALLCLLTDIIDADILCAEPRLRVLSNYAVGYNNIDVAAATARRLPATNTLGILTETTADLTFALLLAVARRVVEGDRLTREGRFSGWGPMSPLGSDVYGKTLRIVGMGHIVTRRAVSFGMRILYVSRHPKPEVEHAYGAVRVELEPLLRESDFVSIPVPLTEETYHLIAEPQLPQMKPTAFLINTSRGPVVDEKAPVVALQEKWISGAGLDIYEREPLLEPGLAELENTVSAPHLGSATVETRTRTAMPAAENAIAVVQTRRPPHCVNPEVFD